MKLTIAISMGDPAGVGPEVTAKALADQAIREMAQWVIVGERWIGKEYDLGDHQVIAEWEALEKDTNVAVLDTAQVSQDRKLAAVDADCGSAGLAYVRIAARKCQEGHATAMVTAPLCKEAVALSEQQFTGHTEYIAELCGAPDSRLMLYHEKLCVVHVSTHCSLVEATKLETERIVRTILLGSTALQRLGFSNPRVAVCGLNPHAGENGLFGDEEARFITPAIEAARRKGIDCSGPYPADTLFLQAVEGQYNLVVAMYHDQGHAPMKLFDFENTVNVTLGLPIIRTSVDHGTAFDIAGKNMASPNDMKQAMRLAVQMATHRA